MSKYTVDEKVRFNREYVDNNPLERLGIGSKEQARWEFGSGYSMAVTLYREYPKADKKTKAIIDGIIAQNKLAAKHGDSGGKGFMCGMRDAANERKAKHKR